VARIHHEEKQRRAARRVTLRGRFIAHRGAKPPRRTMKLKRDRLAFPERVTSTRSAKY